MRLTTWNVNGIRNPFGYAPWNTDRTFTAMFDILQSDIVVMQELKIQRKDLRDDMVLLDGWDCYFSLPKHKKGYSGVGIYTRNKTCAPIKAEEGVLGVLAPPGSSLAYRDLPADQSIGGYPTEAQIAELGVDPQLLDSEGRCVCLEFPAFVLFGVYSPANSNGLRDDFRYGFLCALDRRIRNLVSAGKRVILTGDLNVSRAEIDTANCVENMKKEGITHDEYISTPNRRVFNQLIVGGEIVGKRDKGRETAIMHDIVRDFHPTRTGMFTHWEQKVNARPGNFGSRIDFVLVSNGMEGWFANANIQEGLMGSDHCPVYGEFKNHITVKDADGKETEAHILDFMNPEGRFSEGRRVKEWSIKSVPAFSGRLLPEFDKRRSIKDMFKRPTMGTSATSVPLTNGQSLEKPEQDWFPTTPPGMTTITQNSVDGETSEGLQPLASPTVTSASKSPGTKRKPTTTPIPAPTKKSKVATSGPLPRSDSQKGQQSLKGFFAPSQSRAPNLPRTDTSASLPSNAAPESILQHGAPSPSHRTSCFTRTDSAPASPPRSPSPATVHDPVAAKESWDSLMRRPAAPLCESHAEPCKVMLTRKKGENQGRSFWMCARPLGPTGAKERGSQWRCPTFIWCSDWRGEGA